MRKLCASWLQNGEQWLYFDSWEYPGSAKGYPTNFIKGVTRHWPTAATHVLVFMISNETKRRKPYLLPVQCIPYKGLADAKVCDLANDAIHERQLKIAGKTLVLVLYSTAQVQRRTRSHETICSWLNNSDKYNGRTPDKNRAKVSRDRTYCNPLGQDGRSKVP